MKAIICDACKKVLEEKEIKRLSFYWTYYELCEECYLKANKIKKYVEKENEEINKIQNALNKKVKDMLEEIGIKESESNDI